MKNKKIVTIPLMPGTYIAALDNRIVNVLLLAMQKKCKGKAEDT